MKSIEVSQLVEGVEVMNFYYADQFPQTIKIFLDLHYKSCANDFMFNLTTDLTVNFM